MVRIFLLFAFFLLVCPVTANSSEVFRCGAEIVKVGDSTDTVRKLCGKPSRTESGGKSSPKKSKKKSKLRNEDDSEQSSAKGKKWYYDRGYGDYVYILTFKGNTLDRIQTSERGGK
jgi:hypothetical protein